MIELKKEELVTINGGSLINATIINALVRGMGTVLDIGRSLGSGIRRMLKGKACPI